MRKRAAGFLLVLALGPATAASAAQIDVRYVLGVGIPSGATSAGGGGTLALRYQAPSSGAGLVPLPGPVTLLGGNVDFHQTTLFSPNPTGMAVGGIRVELRLQFESALGTLRPTGTLLLPQVRGLAAGTVSVCCNPGPIRQVLAFDPVSFDWSAPLHLDGTQLRASALVPKRIELGRAPGFPVDFTLTIASASEIDRHLVPEPSSLPLVSGGLAALALLAANRPRARR